VEEKTGPGAGDAEPEVQTKEEGSGTNQGHPNHQYLKAQARPIFVIRLRPEIGVDGARALRRALKVLLRRFRLQCTDIREERP
jgi:hypothetical protein